MQSESVLSLIGTSKFVGLIFENCIQATWGVRTKREISAVDFAIASRGPVPIGPLGSVAEDTGFSRGSGTNMPLK